MLNPKITLTTDIDSTGTKIYLDDATVYGGSELLRNQVAIYLIANLVDSNGKNTPLTLEPYNPLTVSKFTVLIPKDGIVSFQLVIIPTVQTPDITDYDDGDFVYSLDDSKVYKASLINNDLVFVIPTLSDYVTASIISGVSFELFLANSTLVLIQLMKQLTEKYIDSENLSNVKSIKLLIEQMNKVRTIMQAAIYQFTIDNYFSAQRYLEFLTTNNYGKIY